MNKYWFEHLFSIIYLGVELLGYMVILFYFLRKCILYLILTAPSEVEGKILDRMPIKHLAHYLAHMSLIN